MAKVYVVGLDGSDIGYQALRLAAMVMNPEDDKIEVLHICLPGDDGEVATRLAHNAEIELRKAQVNPLRFKICTETLRAGWTLIGQLIYDANHHANGSAVLVIGDHGSGGEGKQHPKGQPPMGKCAEACINRVKVPVLLVRGHAKALLQQHHSGGTTQRRGKRTQDSRGNLHDEAPGGHGLNIAVCVDGSNLSKKAFDMGLKLCRDGASDMLTAMHIDNGDWQGRPPAALTAMTQYYNSECAKASHNHEELVAQFTMVAKQPGNSLKNDLLKQLDAADIAVMGSMELSNFEKNVHLGSMAQAVARQSTAHVMIVKNYTATGG